MKLLCKSCKKEVQYFVATSMETGAVKDEREFDMKKAKWFQAFACQEKYNNFASRIEFLIASENNEVEKTLTDSGTAKG